MIKKETNYYVIFLYFCNFVDQNKKWKLEWKERLSGKKNKKSTSTQVPHLSRLAISQRPLQDIFFVM